MVVLYYTLRTQLAGSVCNLTRKNSVSVLPNSARAITEDLKQKVFHRVKDDMTSS